MTRNLDEGQLEKIRSDAIWLASAQQATASVIKSASQSLVELMIGSPDAWHFLHKEWQKLVDNKLTLEFLLQRFKTGEAKLVQELVSIYGLRHASAHMLTKLLAEEVTRRAMSRMYSSTIDVVGSCVSQVYLCPPQIPSS